MHGHHSGDRYFRDGVSCHAGHVHRVGTGHRFACGQRYTGNSCQQLRLYVSVTYTQLQLLLQAWLVHERLRDIHGSTRPSETMR